MSLPPASRVVVVTTASAPRTHRPASHSIGSPDGRPSAPSSAQHGGERLAPDRAVAEDVREDAAVGERLRRLAERVDERVVPGAAVADRRARCARSRAPRGRSAASRSPPPSGDAARPAIAATHTSSVNTSRSAISAALGSSPSNQTATKPGPQRPLERLGGQRRRHLEQLAHAVEVVRDHPLGEVAAARPAPRAPGISRPAGGWKWMPFGASSSTGRPAPRTRSAARRTRARTRARTRRASRSPRRRDLGRASRRPCAAATPRARAAAAAAARPATRRSPRASSRSRWSREKCARRASARAVRARLVERVEHQVDQLAQAVGHAPHLDRIRRPAGRGARRRAPWRACPAGPTSRPPRPSSPRACARASTPTPTRRSPPSAATARRGSPAPRPS